MCTSYTHGRDLEKLSNSLNGPNHYLKYYVQLKTKNVGPVIKHITHFHKTPLEVKIHVELNSQIINLICSVNGLDPRRTRQVIKNFFPFYLANGPYK